MKAALAATTYRAFDPDNNGAIDPVDIVKVFAHVEGVTWEQAHSIAYAILEDADTDDGKDGGQFGLSFEEYITCLEGDAIKFPQYLKGLKARPEAGDRDECRLAFEEERAKLPPPSKGVRRAETLPPPTKLELGADAHESRLKSKGMLKVHVQVCAAIPPMSYLRCVPIPLMSPLLPARAGCDRPRALRHQRARRPICRLLPRQEGAAVKDHLQDARALLG